MGRGGRPDRPEGVGAPVAAAAPGANLGTCHDVASPGDEPRLSIVRARVDEGGRSFCAAASGRGDDILSVFPEPKNIRKLRRMAKPARRVGGLESFLNFFLQRKTRGTPRLCPCGRQLPTTIFRFSSIFRFEGVLTVRKGGVYIRPT
ncbi:MAG TPA: hypothetical protein PLJ34_07625, partial [Hyphomicrobiales bacterium]|nr:hypothetical protein [Hyphomicrobiales bacterium]